MSFKFPSFSDLGKDCRDLFKRGYQHVGLLQVDVKNQSYYGMKAKETYPQWMTTTAKRDMENNLSFSHGLSLIPGGDATLQGLVNPYTKNANALLKLQYQDPRCTLEGSLSGGNDSSVIVGGSIVSGGHCGIIAGYKVDYDTSAGQLASNNIVLGYQTNDYGLFLTYDNLTILNGSYFHRVNRDVKVGVQSTVLEGERRPMFSVGGKFTFNDYGDSLRVYVNTKRVLFLELGLKIQEGLQVFVSSDIDLKTASTGSLNVGFGLQFWR